MKKITNIMMAVLLSGLITAGSFTSTRTYQYGIKPLDYKWSIAGLYRQEFNIIYNLQQI